MKKIILKFKQDHYFALLFFILIFLAIFSPLALKPKIAGDSLLYVDSINVIRTGIRPAGFMPEMILTTPLGLKAIMLFDIFFHDLAISWLIVDVILYVSAGLFFHSLLKKIFKEENIAFLGSLFLMTNYAIIVFGLGYLMDMGGWAFYLASIYFTYRYLEEAENKWLYFASLAIGLGGLYKEYAFVAYVVLFGVILFKHWRKWRDVIKQVFVSGLISFLPFALMNVYTFINYDHYTYWNWFTYQKVYAYQDRVVEFIKSFGSIYNFAWFLFLPGFYLLLKRYREVFREKRVFFIWLVITSSFAILLWPVVTRVLFISMPAAVLVTCLFIERIEKRMLYILPVLFLYIITNFLMDAFILNFININPIIKFLGL